jgi:hypothetical protein
MKMYKCTLTNSQGAVEETFYRQGASIADVLRYLKMMPWPDSNLTVHKLNKYGEEEEEE